MGLLTSVFEYVLTLENTVGIGIRSPWVGLGLWRQVGPMERIVSEKPRGLGGWILGLDWVSSGVGFEIDDVA